MTIIGSALAGISIGEARSFRNLTMFPLITRDQVSASYFTLDEGLARGGIHVTEVSEDASVSDLKVDNALDGPVLLLDGEEVVGAKQNRVFNLTILADLASLPNGAMATLPGDPGQAFLVWRGKLFPWNFAGYGVPTEAKGQVTVLTPPTTLAALRAGYRPRVHPSALV